MQNHLVKFRLDRRLQLRRGWVAPDQLAKELAALPDVSEKAELVESPQHPGSEAAPAVESEAE